ncbi:hypothetical protein [Sinorhizobium fredii]|uniref:hypothetical protein n=1 Tax=Rhizobium fredii TaxID=380 RepID=UPI001294964D|nr:hypothetical protein [Sinorhizobium fredii]MQW94041.1 hypothetical protein [Sinorhizobium fredii]
MASRYNVEFQFRNKRFQDASSGLKAFSTALKKDWDGSAKILSDELTSFLTSVAEALASRHGTPWPGGTTAQTLSRRSGKLAGSILRSVDVGGNTFETIEGTIGADFPGVVHEFGATIKPKTAKYLAIPLPAALDSKGVPLKKGPRDWAHTFVSKSKAGNLIIFQRRGTQVIPLYVLKSSVTIPPRLGMQKTLDAGLPYFVDRSMDAIVRAVQQAA